MAAPIDFYFDFSSPYAYFGSQKIDEVAMEFGGREVTWRPMLLGVALKETGNKSLADQPIKGEYTLYDCERLARFMKVPWTVPEKFPVMSLAAGRAFYWIDSTDPEKAKTFARNCLTAYFGEGRDITDKDLIAEIGVGVGVDGNALKDAIATPEVKDMLKAATQSALEAGVFGSPFYIIDGEKFWGSDRIWMIKRWLKSGGW